MTREELYARCTLHAAREAARLLEERYPNWYMDTELRLAVLGAWDRARELEKQLAEVNK